MKLLAFAFVGVVVSATTISRPLDSYDPSCNGVRLTSRSQFCCGGAVIDDASYQWGCCSGTVCRNERWRPSVPAPSANDGLMLVPNQQWNPAPAPQNGPLQIILHAPGLSGQVREAPQQQPQVVPQNQGWNPFWNFWIPMVPQNIQIPAEPVQPVQFPPPPPPPAPLPAPPTPQTSRSYCNGVDLTAIQSRNPYMACCANTELYDVRQFTCYRGQVTSSAPLPPPPPPPPQPRRDPTPNEAFASFVCDRELFYVDPRISSFYQCCADNIFDTRVEKCEQANRVSYQPMNMFRVVPTAGAQQTSRAILVCGSTHYVFATANEARRYTC